MTQSTEAIETATHTLLIPELEKPGLAQAKPRHQKHQTRTQAITVRFDERHYPEDVLLKLHNLRSEVTNLNRACSNYRKAYQQACHERRLFSRVLRLKSEAAEHAVKYERRRADREAQLRAEAAEMGVKLESSFEPESLPTQDPAPTLTQ
jgi:hypothetical protein